MIIHLNGALIDEMNAVVSVYDHGFLYGMGLFETFRTYAGRPYRLREHMERLAKGCRELRIGYEPDVEEATRIVGELLAANKLADAYVRWTVTGGVGPLGLPAGAYDKPQVIVYVKELAAPQPQAAKPGKPLQLLSLRRNSPEGSVRHKSLHYMNNILGKMELSGYPSASRQAEGLFLDSRDFAAEGLVSNLFIVRGGVCATPAIETGILPGITRAAVLELAEKNGLRTEQGLYTWTDLLHADELFLTNSIQEIVPVTELIDLSGVSTAIAGGSTGPVTQLLLEKYRIDATSGSR